MKIERSCKNCGAIFMAKKADVERGWAKNCSKSCAASTTNRKTGNHQRFQTMKRNAINREREGGINVFGEPWDDHKNC